MERSLTYRELGPDYFSRVSAERTKRRCIAKLHQQLGFDVTITPKGAA